MVWVVAGVGSADLAANGIVAARHDAVGDAMIFFFVGLLIFSAIAGVETIKGREAA